jgi:hypothetical protein
MGRIGFKIRQNDPRTRSFFNVSFVLFPENEQTLHVHHIIPFRNYVNPNVPINRKI